MRTLTSDTIIKVRAEKPALTGETRIKLSQIKDLESWVEDKRYEVGQISEKTGLQKQPDGSWKEPKKEKSRKDFNSESNSSDYHEPVELTEEQKAKTKVVEDRINKKGWFKNPSNLEGVHPDFAENIERQCEKIFKDYPKLKGFVEGITTEKFSFDERKVFAKSKGAGKYKSEYIILNTSYFSNTELLNNEYEKLAKENYHPLGTTADSIIVHEFGHCICDFLAQQSGDSFENYNRKVIAKAEEEFKKAGYSFDKTNGLTGYSFDTEACPDTQIKDAEIIAEAFAEFKCSKNPRIIPLYIWNLLEGEIL